MRLPCDLLTEYGCYPIRFAQAVAEGVALGLRRASSPAAADVSLAAAGTTNHGNRRHRRASAIRRCCVPRRSSWTNGRGTPTVKRRITAGRSPTIFVPRAETQPTRTTERGPAGHREERNERRSLGMVARKFTKLVEHAKKWAGLPVMPQPAGVAYPAHDGDIALLEEMADRVFYALNDLPRGDRLAAVVTLICRGRRWRERPDRAHKLDSRLRLSPPALSSPSPKPRNSLTRWINGGPVNATTTPETRSARTTRSAKSSTPPRSQKSKTIPPQHRKETDR
ncbi:hypothetical protein I552_10202 [Mycobacterium xenopi 3993]|nr:hypothetical protein I552_9666 [Mycobacterium xenopi 3993]EUA31269.1 hypothetical protein I552_10202 [Mycobacterium xenopi 3993]